MLREKSKLLICIAAVIVMAAAVMPPAICFAADQNAGVQVSRTDEFKVIGYYCGEQFDVPVEKLQAEKLTHVMYGFLIPTEDGTCKPFQEPEELTKLIETCHSAGTKVYVSVGGYFDKDGSPLFYIFEKIGADDGLRTIFVNNIVAVVQQYGFDGVEMDWEYPRYESSADYEKTILLLSEKLKLLGKGLSTALPGTGSIDGKNVWEALAGVTDKTIACFDFINLMCYDLKTGPNHSPVWYSKTTINYWKQFRNVPAEKIVLGMPLYARPSWQQYRFLVEMDRENAYRDYVATEPLESTYNGLNTLREKTMIAFREAGGVMLFDVNEDTYDDTSAVSMIYDLKWRMMDYSKEELKQNISIILDDRELVLLKEEGYGVPFIDSNNRTLIPLRKPMEAIGAVVSYDANSRVVTVIKNDITVKVAIGASTINVNGQKVAMDTKAIIKDDRTYIPLRAIFYAFGYDVQWHGSSRTVIIS